MKALGTVLGGFIGVALGIWAMVTVWVDYIVPAVPAGPYHNLILIGIGALVLLFGWGLVAIFIVACGAVFSFIFNLITPGK